MKTCTKCGESKPANREYFGSTPAGNLRGACRVCMCATVKAHEMQNPNRKTKRGNSAKKSHGHHAIFKLKKQNYRCVYCRTKLTTDSCQLDHITPTSRGGKDTPENLQALCRQCNQDKHAKTHDEHIHWRMKVGLGRQLVGRS